MLIFTAIRHLSMSKKFVTKQEWLIHTARDREREWDREQDQERWVYVFCYVLFTLHRDRDREGERGPLGSIPIYRSCCRSRSQSRAV